MSTYKTYGPKGIIIAMKTHHILQALYKRSGYPNYAELARKSGYKDASGVQRYFEPKEEGEYLSLKVVRKLCKGLVGKGSPPITKSEVMALAGPLDVDFEVERRTIDDISNLDKYQIIAQVMKTIDTLNKEDQEIIAIRIANNLKKSRR